MSSEGLGRIAIPAAVVTAAIAAPYLISAMSPGAASAATLPGTLAKGASGAEGGFLSVPKFAGGFDPAVIESTGGYLSGAPSSSLPLSATGESVKVPGFFERLGSGIAADTKGATPGSTLRNVATAGVGGAAIGSLTNPPPAPPFQMRSAEAPSPVVSPGGRFQPTSDNQLAMLANKMAQRQAQQRGIRFA